MDQTQDTGYTQLHECTQIYGEMPDYVKDASVRETLAPEGLLTHAYADMIGRKYPIHTKAACYVSAIYYLENQGSVPADRRPYISARISQFAEKHGIADDIKGLVQKNQEAIKQANALCDDDYLIPDEGKYPIRNAAEVKIAAHWLVNYRDIFRFEDRQKMAEQLLNKAASLNANLTPGDELDTLQKMAGFGTYDPGVVYDQLQYRTKLTRNTAAKDVITKIASTLETNPGLALDRKSALEVASAIDWFDRSIGVHHGALLKRAEDFMFCGLFEPAADFLSKSAGTATGAIFTYDQLSEVTRDDACELWGDKVASTLSRGVGLNVEKVASHIIGLPYRDAIAFGWHMRDKGCEPARQVSVGIGISADQRQSLADQYARA